jgi:NADH-quinone oxidoreductase subunit A
LAVFADRNARQKPLALAGLRVVYFSTARKGGCLLLEDFGFVGLFIIVAILFSAMMVVLPLLLRRLGLVPHHPNAVKTAPFECGVETIGKTWVQFNFRYYFYALIFLAMDVLAVFLYPWAAELRRLGASGLVAVLAFVAIVGVGYMYAWQKKVLEWK